MKITIDTQKPTEVVTTVGTKKVKYSELAFEAQSAVCTALEAARHHCSMTLKTKEDKDNG